MKNAVLDSYALLSFLFREAGHEIILNLFEKALEFDNSLFISSPNWAEVRYMVERKAGKGKWYEIRGKLLGLPIEIIDADKELAEMAGELKTTKKMSLADCFAAALAKRQKAAIYTGDPEFRAVEGEVKVVWI